jgi:hypothetical protein
MYLQDILLIFLSVGKVAGSVMLPAVLEEHALSLLEIWENVKGEDGIFYPSPRQTYGSRGA